MTDAAHANGELLDLTLRIWRQAGSNAKGGFKNYKLHGISTHMSFLEMLDVLNEQLIARGKNPSPSITIAGKASAGCAAW